MRASATPLPSTTTNTPTVTQIHKRLLFLVRPPSHLPRLENRSRSPAEKVKSQRKKPEGLTAEVRRSQPNADTGVLVCDSGRLNADTQAGAGMVPQRRFGEPTSAAAMLCSQARCTVFLLVECVAVAMLILANGFFVAAEFALVSIRDTRIQQMLADRVPGARAVRRLQHGTGRFSSRRAAGRDALFAGAGLDRRAPGGRASFWDGCGCFPILWPTPTFMPTPSQLPP